MLSQDDASLCHVKRLQATYSHRTSLCYYDTVLGQLSPMTSHCGRKCQFFFLLNSTCVFQKRWQQRRNSQHLTQDSSFHTMTGWKYAVMLVSRDWLLMIMAAPGRGISLYSALWAILISSWLMGVEGQVRRQLYQSPRFSCSYWWDNGSFMMRETSC